MRAIHQPTCGRSHLVPAGLILLIIGFGHVTSAFGQAFPAYNKVYGIATHNAYWLDRTDNVDFGASGTQETILDQLLHEHVRALEIDIHTEGAPRGRWRIYHTSDSENFTCRYLDDCLEYLRDFHYANPHHDVINLIIELKNCVPKGGSIAIGGTPTSNFDADHTIEGLDATFRRYLGPCLYTPGEFMSRAPAAKTMVEAAKTAGWPTIDKLRGKFIVTLIGNWSIAALDWVSYASGDMHQRVAFPLQSIFEIQMDTPAPPIGLWFRTKAAGTAVRIKDISDFAHISPGIDVNFPCPPISEDARRAAFDNSVFWQLEDVTGKVTLDCAKTFLANNGVIRGKDAFRLDEQKARLALGIQIIQTDYPWSVMDDGAPPELAIPTDPSRRLRDLLWLENPPAATIQKFREPGARFYAHTILFSEATALADVPATSQRWWETTVSSTRFGNTGATNFARRAQDLGIGGIVASSKDERDMLMISRTKKIQPGPFKAESVSVWVRLVRDGKEVSDTPYCAPRYGPCLHTDWADPNSEDVSKLNVGSLIALAVNNTGNGSTVTAFSTGQLTPEGAPFWHPLGQWTFKQPLTQQGFSGRGDVLFAGPRVADHLTGQSLPAAAPTFARFADFPIRQQRGLPPVPPGTSNPLAKLENCRFVDLSAPEDPRAVIVVRTDDAGTRLTSLAGGDGGFEFVCPTIPPGGRLTAIEGNYGNVVDRLTWYYTDAAGHPHTFNAGGPGGIKRLRHDIPPNVRLVGISGRFGDYIDSVIFHFSDGSATPSFGGSGGHTAYSLTLPKENGNYVGTVVGLVGKANKFVDSIGLKYRP